MPLQCFQVHQRNGALASFLILAICLGTTLAFGRSADKNTSASRVKIVYIGDSVTAGYGMDDRKAYPWLIQKKFEAKKIPTDTTNASVSGSLSSSAPGRIRWILKSKPDVVVLALGGNDGLKATPPKEIETQLREAIQIAVDQKIVVVLAGFKMFANLGTKYTTEFEGVYQDLAKISGVIFIPFLLEGVGAQPKLNLPDGKHPNEKGHQAIAELAYPTIVKAVNRVIESRKDHKKLSTN